MGPTELSPGLPQISTPPPSFPFQRVAGGKKQLCLNSSLFWHDAADKSHPVRLFVFDVLCVHKFKFTGHVRILGKSRRMLEFQNFPSKSSALLCVVRDF